MKRKAFTLSTQLTLQSTWFSMVFLGLFALVLFHQFFLIQSSDMDSFLAARMKSLENTLVVAQTLKEDHPGPHNLAQALQATLSDPSSDLLLRHTEVYLASLSGEILAGVPQESVGSLLEDTSVRDWVPGQLNYSTSGDHRALHQVFHLPRGDAFRLEVRLPLDQAYGPLNQLWPLMLVLVPLFMTAGALVQHSYIKKAFLPLRKLLGALGTLDPQDLSLRLEPMHPQRMEVDSLRIAFNGLLDQVEESYTKQKSFFEDLSHQLRTPLAVLRGELDLGLRRPRTPEEYQGILVSGLEEVDRMKAIVEALLTLARFEARADLPPKTLEDGVDLLYQAVESLSKVSQARGIPLDVFAPKTSLKSYYYKDLFIQALGNLIENALKYAQDGTRATVKLEFQGSWGRVVVHNWGPGIPQDEMGRIFDRFFRGKKNPSGKGFGLGLPLVKAITEAHGGRILAASSPESGTTFELIWPLRVPKS